MYKTQFNIVNEFRENPLLYIRIGLLFLSMVLYSLAIYNAINNYPNLVNNYPYGNLSSIMPLYSWIIPVILLVIIFLDKEDHSKTISILALLFLSILWYGTAPLIEPYPSVYDSYGHFSQVYLIVNGHIETAIQRYTWIGLFLIIALIYSIVPFDSLLFLRFFPLFYGIILTLAIFFYSKKILLMFGQNKEIEKLAAVTTAIFILGNNSIEVHFSPQAIGLLLFVIGLYFLLKVMDSSESYKARNLSLIYLIITFILVTIIHSISFFFFIINIALIFYIEILRNLSYVNNLVKIFTQKIISMYKSHIKQFNQKIQFIILVVVLVFGLLVIYLLLQFIEFVIQFFLLQYLNQLLAIVNNPNATIIIQWANFLPIFYAPHPDATTLRLFVHIFLIIIFLIAFIILNRMNNKPKSHKILIDIIYSLILTSGIYIIMTMVVFQGFLVNRVVIYGYIFIMLGNLFFLIFIKNKAKLNPKNIYKKIYYFYSFLLCLIIILAFYTYISQYNQATIIRKDEFEGIKTVAQMVGNKAYLVSFDTYQLIHYFLPADNNVLYDNKYWSLMDWNGFKINEGIVNLTDFFSSTSLCVIMTKQMILDPTFYGYHFEINRVNVLNNVTYTLLYLNASILYQNDFVQAWNVSLI